ncbi:MAG: hypothetical protein KF851_07045 [Pirellulaceae bacterium]|nr:hypothetical protein [Pirellulaceae bacterium]
MNLFLDFGNNQILGQGTDYVGPWSISGVLAPDSRECDWTKQYVGKHSVRYQGTWSETGIRGRWSIGSLISGDFHIWPAELTEIQAAYLEQETQLNPVSKNR